MPEHSILIVAVDGLRASALGAYGNTSYATPALDELAAECFLLDSCYASSAELPAIYRALWQSVHPLRTSDYAAHATSLPRRLSQRGYRSTLVTDVAEVASLAAQSGFDDCIHVTGEAEARVEEVSQTTLAQVFAEARETIAAPHSGPRMVWIHARGMYGRWDAPVDMQQLLLDEDDPPPIEALAPPDVFISEADDPDTAFRYAAAYAAQVMVLDACWGALREWMATEGTDDEWLVMFLGTRGFPLGEHRRVGGVDPRWYAEQLHVPWLVRIPGGQGRLARSGSLTSSLDLVPTLLESIDGVPNAAGGCDGLSVATLARSARAAWRDVLVFSGEATPCKAIRTPAWSLQYALPPDGNIHAVDCQLFVRPDDRCEANDVAALCPDVLAELVAVSEEVIVRIRRGDAIPGPELSDELRASVG